MRYSCRQPLNPEVARLACSADARCVVTDGVRDCQCGDGQRRNRDGTCEGESFPSTVVVTALARVSRFRWTVVVTARVQNMDNIVVLL